ncbi:MAG TPA: DUF4190 domain-containing protein [Amycolatopsis sp.]|nr:DUF4190 domain-containing protein [Amycolatopsis sp.]
MPSSTPSSPAPTQPKNGFGTTGFVLGLVGLIFAFIPLIGVVAWPLTILGLIFGIIGLVRANRGQANNKGMAVTAIVLSVIGLVICIVWTAAFGKAVNDTANSQPKPAAPAAADAGAAPARQAPAASAKHTIVLEVTTAAKSNVQWNSGFTANSQDVLEKGKTWRQTLTMDDLAFTSVTVTPVDFQLGSKDNTCKITVDGKTVVEQSNSAAAFCTYQP